MTIRKTEIDFIDIPGVDVPVRPAAQCVTDALAEAQDFAKKNGLVVLNSPEINTIADFLEKEDPDENWVKQQAEKLNVSEETIRKVYADFRSDVWDNYYLMTTEVLILPPFSEKRLDYPDLDMQSKKPILLRDCRILKKGLPGPDQDFILSDGEVIEVDLPIKDGVMPKNIIKLLNAREETRLYIESKPGFHDSERLLSWDFRFRMGIKLYAGIGPIGSWGDASSFLMGKKT